ncbi:MAG: OmpA family protein [Bacteroidota bacterium]
MIITRNLLFTALLLLLTGCATAQPGNQLKKKDQKTLTEARSALDLGQFIQARTLLDGLIKRNPAYADLFFMRAMANGEVGDFNKAANDFLQGIEVSEGKNASRVYKELGLTYAKAGQFEQAVAAYQESLDRLPANARPERKIEAETLLAKAQAAAALAVNPVPFTPVPVLGGINTQEHLEYFPSLSVDGERMILTRRVNGQEEDFYLSRREADGSWSVAEPLDGVNTEFNEGAQSITADGTYLVFTACDRPDGAGSCDLYFAEKDEVGWTRAQNLGPNINTRDYEAQPSISADGQLLFFSSRRPGGVGNIDLYVSGRLPNGGWSTPINLGKTINTSGNDQYPFWASDGKTLFFTSDGHPGLGGDDLFRAELSPNNEWQPPINLGFPINTADNETNLFVALGGSTAYFSKGQRDAATGKMDVDIYQFELPAELRPTAATYAAARVVDAVTGKPIEATVRLRPLDQSVPPFARRTAANGRFLAVLPAGKDYALTVDKAGYIFYADRFTLADGFTQEDPYQLAIKLQPVPTAVDADGAATDGVTTFKNVLFETGSATLLPVSFDELDRLVELLAEAPNLRVEIAGHTDDVGEAPDNLTLSEQRAAAVKTYLMEQGLDEVRISTQGYGETQPIASNDTEAGRAQNRRTTFRLASN